MLTEITQKTFNELLKTAQRDELIWMSGFLSGLVARDSLAFTTPNLPTTNATTTTLAPTLALSQCTLVFGTETGNAKRVATELSTQLKKHGTQTKLKGLDQYRLSDLAKETHLIVVISTQGEGEPPAAARKFYDYLYQTADLNLSKLHFAVIGLGDSAYPLFCKASEDVDAQLAALGAQRLFPLRQCDTDFEPEVQNWLTEFTQTVIYSNSAPTALPAGQTTARIGKKNYTGTILTNLNLNDRDSNKETYHIEIESEDEIIYQAGDSLGLVPHNSAETVEALLTKLSLNPNDSIEYKGTTYGAKQLFTEKLNVQYLPERVIQAYARLTAQTIPAERMDLLALLTRYPTDFTNKRSEIIASLEATPPRLYSISSSPLAHGNNEIHITVSRHQFKTPAENGALIEKYGFCSNYLAQLPEGTNFSFYIQANHEFKLPTPETDIIMIGPGTGIAPFRSFLFEREARGDSGRNWLFFGEQHFSSDFLYQTELQTLLETGVLTRLNTAFSRDQAQKIYVQHKLLQQAEDVFNWLEAGAVLYLCGAKDPMSVDVENALIQIIAERSQRSPEQARAYLDNLHEQGRYHKDVY
ncbi:diflavin oxidoreductase [Beggiatoa leptomitoformis]|uniref:assimilatory sulfite reductase (NADPH) n=1 Tax=Beggiatoa leptomitoformis TaxID=288004 RepID=A0A2N9YDM2_9GAMM|nr:flavodoxin domain-containing protein [Beggiatoa leptomitoformis]ALG69126.1 sulfite reductase [Beggiatoa leptomitoformis]AUI68459.1 sulfite reductase [Beggiatoa leptomitoformis]